MKNMFFIRIFISILFAHLIIAHEEDDSFLELLSLRRYYFAMLGSSCMAFSIIELVYRVTIILDKKYLWVRSFFKRLWCQYMFGVICPLCLIALETTIYCHFRNINIITDTTYFKRYTLLILFMILFLNAVCIILYFFRRDSAAYKRKKEEQKHQEEILILEKSIHVNMVDIVLFYSHKKNYFSVTADGEELYWKFTMDETFKLLSKTDYFFINRSYIVHRNNIEKVKTGSSHRREIILKKPMGSLIVVSQRRTRDFLLWFGGKV